jgi:membrane-bound lytic murein transglycosylase C
MLISPLASQAVELTSYDVDVAALLREYQGSTPNSALDRPSVLTITNENESSTFVDFDRGLILIETADKSQLKQAIVQVLLPQVTCMTRRKTSISALAICRYSLTDI